jgi:hypothetical protein
LASTFLSTFACFIGIIDLLPELVPGFDITCFITD